MASSGSSANSTLWKDGIEFFARALVMSLKCSGQGCVGVPVTDDVKTGKRAMKITQRQDTWAGPVQSLKYGAHIIKNVVYTAQIWVKSLGKDSDMDTYELTVKVDYR